MNYTTSVTSDSVVLHLAGRFDAHETDGFRSFFEHSAGDLSRRVVVDLSQVTFIDSSALAELVRGLKYCKEERGDELQLLSPSDPIRVILELTGLDRVFNMLDHLPLERSA